ncbi:MAG: UDP-3-O-acyl-N-acetylglucosamine deacetylase [Alphaproteobacteria bacterium]|nr:UDP-3-O-acyl-N-acetylglucosamine deacetylase [Alphaproteobacteria bacterium]
MPTFKGPVKISGHGIHSGAPVHMTIKPSDNPGIFFVRTDIPGSQPIAATFDNVGDTSLRNTTVGHRDGAHVQTVEHLMAALFLMGVDRAVIEIDGPETPILDGSAAQFLDVFARVGVTSGALRTIVVKKDVVAHQRELIRRLPWRSRIMLALHNLMTGRRSNGYVRLSPNDGAALTVRATLVYPEPVIGAQTYEYRFDGGDESVQTFASDIARARTFGKYSEWEYLKARHMARGANETNVIALNNAGDGTLNPLIWPDEFVRHKIIDAIGDMFTSGGFIRGDLTSYKGSHALNNLVLKKLFSDPANYDIIESTK